MASESRSTTRKSKKSSKKKHDDAADAAAAATSSSPAAAVPFSSPLTAAHVVGGGVGGSSSQHQGKKKRHDKNMTDRRSRKEEEEVSEAVREEKRERRRRRKAKRAKLEREEAEEARLTEMLFGGVGGGGGDAVGWGGIDDEDGGGAEEDGGYSRIEFDGPRAAATKSKKKKKKRAEGGGGKPANDDSADRPSVGLFEIDRGGVEVEDEAEAADGGIDDGGGGAAAWDDSDEQGDDASAASTSSRDDDDDDDEPKAAWVDDDDEDMAVSLMSTSRLRKLRYTPDETDALSGKEYERRLRERYQKTAGATARTDWADLGARGGKEGAAAARDRDRDSGESESDEEEEADGPSASSLLASTAPLLSSTSSRVPPNILKIIRCPDANLSDPNKSVVSSVQFHPGSDPDAPLLLTAGLDKTLRFFRVNGGRDEADGNATSEKVHGIHFPNLPIYSASFLGDSGNVVVSGRRPYFYIYDAVAGKIDKVPNIPGRDERSLEKFAASPDGRLIAFIGNDGYIVLVEAATKMWVADLKMNGSARAVTFTPDGNNVIASGGDGEVYRWDIRSKRCVDRFVNEDGTITSSLSASSRFLAVGAESGVVNLYNDRFPSSGRSININTRRQPIKSIMNLQTSADHVKFNHDGQILAMSSRREKNSMKVLHVPTATVFSNWPTSKTPLNYVWSMDFGPGSKYMTIGNDKGKCLLYRLSHYEND